MITEDLKISDSILWTPVLHIPTSRNGELESQHTTLQLLIFHHCTGCFAIAHLPQLHPLLLQLLIFHNCTRCFFAIAHLPQLHQLLYNCSSSTIAPVALQLLIFHNCTICSENCLHSTIPLFTGVFFVTIELFFFLMDTAVVHFCITAPLLYTNNSFFAQNSLLQNSISATP